MNRASDGLGAADPTRSQKAREPFGGGWPPRAQSREERGESGADGERAHVFASPELNREPSM